MSKLPPSHPTRVNSVETRLSPAAAWPFPVGLKSDPAWPGEVLKIQQPERSTEFTAESFVTLIECALDITGAAMVEVSHSPDHKVLWVNVNGVCVLRVGNITRLEMKA